MDAQFMYHLLYITCASIRPRLNNCEINKLNTKNTEEQAFDFLQNAGAYGCAICISNDIHKWFIYTP